MSQKDNSPNPFQIPIAGKLKEFQQYLVNIDNLLIIIKFCLGQAGLIFGMNAKIGKKALHGQTYQT